MLSDLWACLSVSFMMLLKKEKKWGPGEAGGRKANVMLVCLSFFASLPLSLNICQSVSLCVFIYVLVCLAVSPSDSLSDYLSVSLSV
jgi:hypothetical protein